MKKKTGRTTAKAATPSRPGAKTVTVEKTWDGHCHLTIAQAEIRDWLIRRKSNSGHKSIGEVVRQIIRERWQEEQRQALHAA